MQHVRRRILPPAFINDGTGGDLASVVYAGLANDLVIGFAMEDTASARPISNAGAIAFTGATSPSATSAGNAASFLAPTDAVAVTCSGGTAKALMRWGYRGARGLHGAVIQVATGMIHTIPPVKALRHGWRFFIATMTETVGRSVTSDDLGLGALQSTSISGYSRHRWIGPESLGSYGGGSFTLNGSAECWTIYGWAR